MVLDQILKAKSKFDPYKILDLKFIQNRRETHSRISAVRNLRAMLPARLFEIPQSH